MLLIIFVLICCNIVDAIIVFLFFRNWIIALRPLIDIPVSLVGSFFIMYLFGFSINVLTLLAIVLATGLVVDDGIVVTDSQTLRSDFVIVATDPTTAHQLIAGRKIPEVLPSTTWYHVTTWDLKNSDILAAQKTGAIVNSIVISEHLPSYAPSGSLLIATTTLNVVSESDVRRELSNIWGISTHDWQLLAKYEIKQSLPFHGVGTPLYTKQHIEGGLFIAGDHCTYPSQQGAMESGRLAAEEIIRRVALKR